MVVAPTNSAFVPSQFSWGSQIINLTQSTLRDLERLGLTQNVPEEILSDLLQYQLNNGLTLGQILRESEWCNKLGLRTEPFKATWYIANPFDLLTPGLQEAIRKRPEPFKSRAHLWQWCRSQNISKAGRQALWAALIETTPVNLWRAAKGLRPYTKSGAYLEPIVIDQGRGHVRIRDGHMATDPRVIPTGSKRLILLQINGIDYVVKVKAADVGAAVRGRHVDLPIYLNPSRSPLPETRLPHEYIRNPTVLILTPIKSINRGRKA